MVLNCHANPSKLVYYSILIHWLNNYNYSLGENISCFAIKENSLLISAGD
jgi:hypothetical protein